MVKDAFKLARIPDKRVTHILRRRAEVFLRQSYAEFASAAFFPLSVFHVRYIM